jgi:lysophospholipase L1-like esterase
MTPITRRDAAIGLVLPLFTAVSVPAQAQSRGGGFVAAWAASVQGPYPIGNPSAQPNLSWAFPNPAQGARDQTFRLIVKPDIWGRQARLRLSNALGTRPVTFDDVYVGLQNSGSALVTGSSRPVAFAGKRSITIEPGKWLVSDPVGLPFVRDPADPLLSGRKLAVSFHVAGESGPMTWHAKALTSSYVTPPGAGSHAKEEAEGAFPFSTASWYFLDAVEMSAPAGTRVVVAFGDSITDGTASTLNGDDRWPDVLSRRLKAVSPGIVVVNAGIGGNRVVGPTDYTPANPFAGGPSALSRLERDVISLPGVTHVIWFEGINDLGNSGKLGADAVIAGTKEAVAKLHARIPDVRVFGATLTSAFGSSNPDHGFHEEDVQRKLLNTFIRTGGLFDGVIDFDAVTLDPATGGMKAMYVPESTTGGPGDKLHPNRAGYAAMGNAIDLAWFTRR